MGTGVTNLADPLAQKLMYLCHEKVRPLKMKYFLFKKGSYSSIHTNCKVTADSQVLSWQKQ